MTPTMSWLPSRPPDATRAIQPDTLIHPVIHERSGRHFGQAMTLEHFFGVSIAFLESEFKARIRFKDHLPQWHVLSLRNTTVKAWNLECKIHTRPSDIDRQRLDRQTGIQPVTLLKINYLESISTD